MNHIFFLILLLACPWACGFALVTELIHPTRALYSAEWSKPSLVGLMSHLSPLFSLGLLLVGFLANMHFNQILYEFVSVNVLNVLMLGVISHVAHSKTATGFLYLETASIRTYI